MSSCGHCPEEKAQSIIINPPGESGIAGVVKELFIPFDVDVNTV